jgi:hypothetical protein
VSPRRTLLLSLLTPLAALASGAGLTAAPAQAASTPGSLAPRTPVARSSPLVSTLVRPPLKTGITSRGTGHSYDRIVVATGVAAEEGPSLLSRIATRLADERGSVGGPRLGNLKRLSDSELKETVGDPHAFKEDVLGTDKNLSEWDVHREGNQLYLVNKKTGAIVPAD